MPRSSRIALAAALLAMFLLAPGAGAQVATPVASPIATDPNVCTVERRSTAEMRELIQTGLPSAISVRAGTPTGDGGALPVGSDDGEPADEATVAAVTEAVAQFLACQNAGNLPAVATLLTDRSAAAYLSFSLLSFAESYTRGEATPMAEPDALLIDTFLGAIQVPSRVPVASRTSLYGIESATQFDDGRVLVIALLSRGGEEPRESAILLREVEGQYRITFGDEPAAPAGAPAATPAP